MASKSDYAELKVLDHMFNDGTFTAVAVYLALCTVIPTDASTGATITEANYTTYARVAIVAADMSAAAAGSKTTTVAQTFPAVTAGDDTIVGFVIVDSATIAGARIAVSVVASVSSCSVTAAAMSPRPASAAGSIMTVDPVPPAVLPAAAATPPSANRARPPTMPPRA